MHHDIVDYLGGSEHEQAVKVKIALAVTTSPAGALIPYGYPVEGDTYNRSKVSHALGDIGDRLIGKLLNLIV